MYVLTTNLADLALPGECAHHESVVTVGAFDGIHIGHQALIEGMVASAHQEGRMAGLVTFYPHPSAVLQPEQRAHYLTTPGEKAVLLEPCGLDWMVVILFTPQVAETPPSAFVRLLRERLRMRTLWVGPDFALGRDRAGDLSTLQELGRAIGFDVHEVPYLTSAEGKVSSTHIRTLVARGYVEEAARLLGRYYRLPGEVVHGAQRGRCLGYPTANLAVQPDRVIPASGIYATFACLGSERYGSVTNIGVRPTFDNGEPSVEAYLLDYSGDLYGRDLVIGFVARLRPEKRFADVKALVEQIDRDVVQARAILSNCREAAAECPPVTYHTGSDVSD
jgi:riboflavin kinase/FMN adenylyltransferase